MSGLKAVDTDPFLIWHELPRHSYMPGEMPGAPMHPHRGFNEVPYCKEMSGTEGLNFMLCRDNEDNTAQLTPGWNIRKYRRQSFSFLKLIFRLCWMGQSCCWTAARRCHRQTVGKSVNDHPLTFFLLFFFFVIFPSLDVVEINNILNYEVDWYPSLLPALGQPSTWS